MRMAIIFGPKEGFNGLPLESDIDSFRFLINQNDYLLRNPIGFGPSIWPIGNHHPSKGGRFTWSFSMLNFDSKRYTLFGLNNGIQFNNELNRTCTLPLALLFSIRLIGDDDVKIDFRVIDFTYYTFISEISFETCTHTCPSQNFTVFGWAGTCACSSFSFVVCYQY